MKQYNVNEINALKILGRTVKKEGEIPVFWNGGGIELNVKGSALYADIYAEYEFREIWIAYFIDGSFMGRMMLEQGLNHICIFKNVDPGKIRNVKILRETQPMSEDVLQYMAIRALYTDGTFEEVKEGSLKIEFIGDSLTSGEGTYGSKSVNEYIPMHMSSSRQYSTMVSDMLDADVSIISQCGWGVHCGWDNNVHNNIGNIYDLICGPADGKEALRSGAKDTYDFSFKPDVIVINLGTNDACAFTTPPFIDPDSGISYKMKTEADGTYNEADIALFKKDTVSLLKKIRRFNPDAFILWCYGMCDSALEVPICQAMKDYVENYNDTKIDYIQLPPCTEDSKGANAHPGYTDHMKAAMIIATKIKDLELK